MYYVYILANASNSVIYIGMTSDIHRRMFEHKNKLIDGFTKQYNVHKLVYAEEYPTANEAISREKQLKKWRREKKDALINKQNPSWSDLSLTM
ncbi:GIY-YIG nuclease family protein [Bifidobacterium oedipodis]|uniref:Excinuclease ABC subunit C n=1 Tax=Bifidobacterium oedipodis TaxID=2675322 RepID=A0A7Y0EMS5_9BIFI|nr:GIY-YIG nuclease family protein [Bifidobacterium sp. DSM 109957]NMM93149.1 excinuclease ABC subunit C [Bifidobacterium sp. DSM 109957]